MPVKRIVFYKSYRIRKSIIDGAYKEVGAKDARKSIHRRAGIKNMKEAS
jgi:hypothetical protein